jgi:predicted nucleic acid-binding protein
LHPGAAAARLRHAERVSLLTAPEIIDLEVTSVLRRQLLAGFLDRRRAELALGDLMALPVRRVPHRQLLGRCWELRDNLTPHDASYVALAELLGLVLVTADRRLASAAGVRCRVDVLP